MGHFYHLFVNPSPFPNTLTSLIQPLLCHNEICKFPIPISLVTKTKFNFQFIFFYFPVYILSTKELRVFHLFLFTNAVNLFSRFFLPFHKIFMGPARIRFGFILPKQEVAIGQKLYIEQNRITAFNIGRYTIALPFPPPYLPQAEAEVENFFPPQLLAVYPTLSLTIHRYRLIIA